MMDDESKTITSSAGKPGGALVATNPNPEIDRLMPFSEEQFMGTTMLSRLVGTLILPRLKTTVMKRTIH